VTHRVVFAPEATADLLELYDYIAARGGPQRALAYVERIELYCKGFATFPERDAAATIFGPNCELSDLPDVSASRSISLRGR